MVHQRSFVRTFLQSSADAPTLHLWCNRNVPHHRRAYKAYVAPTVHPKGDALAKLRFARATYQLCKSFARASLTTLLYYYKAPLMHLLCTFGATATSARAKLLQSWYVARAKRSFASASPLGCTVGAT